MTRLYLSKLVRKLNNLPVPKICFANDYIPQSFNDVCDCKHFCKYGPKGNDTVNLTFNIPTNHCVIRQ